MKWALPLVSAESRTDGHHKMTIGLFPVYINLQKLSFITTTGLFKCFKDYHLYLHLSLWKYIQNHPNTVLREEEVKSEDTMC